MPLSCPYCGSTDTKVIETRSKDKSDIMRRRRCGACRATFITSEKIRADESVMITGVDGNRRPFHPSRLRTSLLSTELSADKLDEVMSRVTGQLACLKAPVGRSAVRTLSAENLMEIIAVQLKVTDYRAYVRYRLEHTACRDLEDFIHCL